MSMAMPLHLAGAFYVNSLNRKVINKWLISDALWERMRLLIPVSKINSRCPQGRPGTSDRDVMNGIFYVMKTGCQWRALDATGICTGTTAHRRFQEWVVNGVFKNFWIMSLREYGLARGIGWRWLALDSSSCKAPISGSKKQAKTRRIYSSKE